MRQWFHHIGSGTSFSRRYRSSLQTIKYGDCLDKGRDGLSPELELPRAAWSHPTQTEVNP